MIILVAELALGGLLLYFGAEWLVRGSGGLAKSLGVPPLIVGLTVIAYGTSMPELVVSSLAARDGRAAMAVGNVVGSNIANLGLILGLTAAICPLKVEGSLIRRELPVLMFSSIILPVLLWDGVVSRAEGGGLLLGAIAFTAWTVRPVLTRTARPSQAEQGAEAPGEVLGRGRLALLSAVGLALLIVGGKVFVDGAAGLAREAGLSERVVGLTIVAVGTSLPEIAASLVAALRRQPSLAIGNVVGSNIFNVLLVTGSASLVRPLEVPLAEVRIDLAVLLAVSALAVLAMRSARTFSRGEGAVFLAGYLGFCAVVATQ